jgi:uncharacterized membrane protein YagU involved in acid resistance
MTKKLLRVMRWAAIVSGVVSFLAAASLAVEFPAIDHPGRVALIGRPLQWLSDQGLGWRGPLWGILAVLALIAAVTTLLGFWWVSRQAARVVLSGDHVD